MSVDISEIPNDADDFEMSISGTCEESTEAGTSNDIDSGKEIISETVTGCYWEKYGTYSKNMTSADKIFPGGKIIAPISLLNSRIPTKTHLIERGKSLSNTR